MHSTTDTYELDHLWGVSIREGCYTAHTFTTSQYTPLQMIKALTATGWGKQKETHMVTYKAVMRPAQEYASSMWLSLASSTSINKLQVMYNAALRTATGCTQDTKHTTYA